MPTFRIDLVLNHGCLWGVPLDYLIKLCSLKYASKTSSQRRRKRKKIRQRNDGKFGEMKCCLMYFDSVDISRFARQISSRLQIHLKECMTCEKKKKSSLKHKLLASHFLDSVLLNHFSEFIYPVTLHTSPMPEVLPQSLGSKLGSDNMDKFWWWKAL